MEIVEKFIFHAITMYGPYSMANISYERAVQKLILFPEIIVNFEVF